MREFVSKMLRTAGRTRKLFYRVCGLQRCPACDFNGLFVSKRVLWHELITQWELSPQWARHLSSRARTGQHHTQKAPWFVWSSHHRPPFGFGWEDMFLAFYGRAI